MFEGEPKLLTKQSFTPNSYLLLCWFTPLRELFMSIANIMQCCKNLCKFSWFLPPCKSHVLPFLPPSVNLPTPLFLCSHTLSPLPLHYYHKSLPAGRMFLQATVLLTWQQFPDSSFEMLAILSVTKNKRHNLYILINYL